LRHEGVWELDVPLWFALIWWFFFFLDAAPSLFFLVFPLFGCFDLFMIGKFHQTRHEMVQRHSEFSLELSSSTPREIPALLEE
jgi:hypothetical protein